MSNMLLLIVQIVSLFLRNVQGHKDCPDGMCVEPLAKAENLKVQLQSPNLSFGVFDFFKFLRCFPMDRVLAVINRITALLKSCGKCPDGECSFFDLLNCIDLKEAVDIAKEILDIIRDSQVCISGGNEITLGQAAK